MTDEEQKRFDADVEHTTNVCAEAIQKIGAAIDGLTRLQAATAIRFILQMTGTRITLDALLCLETHPGCENCAMETYKATLVTLCATPGIGESRYLPMPRGGGN